MWSKDDNEFLLSHIGKKLRELDSDQMIRVLAYLDTITEQKQQMNEYIEAGLKVGE